MTTARRSLADALAGAFLSGTWTRPGLVETGAVVLGARRRWLGPLARTVLDFYPRPPLDRPRELAAVIEDCEHFSAAWENAASRGRPLAPTVFPVARTRMVRRRWPVPEIDDVAGLAEFVRLDLARLDWLADTRGYQRRTHQRLLHEYRYRWLPRAGRLPRLIEAPVAPLRRVQRQVLAEILTRIPVHECAHGFVRGRSVLSAAEPHTGAAAVVSLDLGTFFTSVTAARVYGLWRAAGYPEPVAHSLTGLTTLATPVAVITAMPPGGDPTDRHRLRAALRTPHLPQGAPTSPALANAIAYRLDARCAGYAAASGLTYTRYADDLLFAGDLDWAGAARLARGVQRIAAAEGFRLNPAKTRVRRAFERQRALGLVLNERARPARVEYDLLRAILHNAARTGAPTQNRDGHPDFRAHLAGRIAWVAAGDPVRAARLQAVFDRIDWSDRDA